MTSQNQLLRDYLKSRPGEWIPMPELAKVITPTGIGAAVHSRVADCRKMFEMDIEQKGEWNGRQNQSSYRYVPAFKLESEAA